MIVQAPRCSKISRSGSWVGRDSYSFHLSPLQIPTEVLPDALEPPDHCELAIGEVFKEAVDQQARDFTPVTITTEGHFFKQHGADGDERCKSITEQ